MKTPKYYLSKSLIEVSNIEDAVFEISLDDNNIRSKITIRKREREK
jgi:hypothetical protein